MIIGTAGIRFIRVPSACGGLNWINPFSNGNGSTSRAIAYFAMCMKQGIVFPIILTLTGGNGEAVESAWSD